MICRVIIPLPQVAEHWWRKKKKIYKTFRNSRASSRRIVERHAYWVQALKRGKRGRTKARREGRSWGGETFAFPLVSSVLSAHSLSSFLSWQIALSTNWKLFKSAHFGRLILQGLSIYKGSPESSRVNFQLNATSTFPWHYLLLLKRRLCSCARTKNRTVGRGIYLPPVLAGGGGWVTELINK